MRGPFVGFFAILFICHNAGATTVVAVREIDYSLIAADSKLTAVEGHLAEGTECKIGVARDVVWAAAGLLFSTEGRGYDLNQIADESMAARGSVVHRIAGFERAIEPPLAAALNSIKLRNPAAFDALLADGPAAQIVFEWFQSGIPRLRSLEFVANWNATRQAVSFRIVSHLSPGRSQPNEAAYVMLGDHAAIDGEMLTNESVAKSIGEPGTVSRLIEKEIAARPQYVAGPVSMLIFTKDGAQWLNKGMCPTR